MLHQTKKVAGRGSGLAALAGLLLAGTSADAGRIFYIDPEAGNDSADGLSPATAWKNPPGDDRATGAVKAFNRGFQPGDVFRFKGGTRYRGSFTPRGSGGTAEAPVVFDGSGWGKYRAIIDGSETLSGVRRCNSAADCLGSPYWKQLWRATVPAAAHWNDWLFVNDRPLMPSQFPAVSTMTDFDDTGQFLKVPLAQLPALQAGRINQPLPAGFDAGTPVLALWVQGNNVAYATRPRISTGGVDFATATFTIGVNKPYVDRTNRFALLNLPNMVNRAGLYAMSPAHGVVIFWPHADGQLPPVVQNGALVAKSLVASSSATLSAPTVSIGGNRSAINMGGLKYMTVRGFSFTNFSARAGAAGGAAVFAKVVTDGAVIADNSFRGFANMANRNAPIAMPFARDIRILRNQMMEMPGTPGVVIDRAHGPVRIECNSFTDMGRTAIRLNDVRGATLRGNYFARVKGVHGNGISAYNDVRETVISENVVVDSQRPFTVHGYTSPYFTEGRPGVKVLNNIFINTGLDSHAIASYGNTQNLEIMGNFLASPQQALKLTATDKGLVVRNNQIIGSVVQPKGMNLVDPETNQRFDPNGNGAAMIDARETARVPAGACS